MTDTDLRHETAQMLMARPWEAAEPESIWEITGIYPRGGGFTDCLAITLPKHVTGEDKPVFTFIGALGGLDDLISPAWITRARPLLLVLRDQPSTAYWVDDQAALDHARRTA